MNKNHWHPENIPEAIRRQSIEKVVTVKLDVDIVRMFGRYFSEVENGNSWVWGQSRGYRGELKDNILAMCFSHIQWKTLKKKKSKIMRKTKKGIFVKLIYISQNYSYRSIPFVVNLNFSSSIFLCHLVPKWTQPQRNLNYNTQKK